MKSSIKLQSTTDKLFNLIFLSTEKEMLAVLDTEIFIAGKKYIGRIFYFKKLAKRKIFKKVIVKITQTFPA